MATPTEDDQTIAMPLELIRTVITTLRSDRGTRLFTFGVWLAMTTIALFFLATQTRNIPITEDWLLVPPLTGSEPDLPAWLWEQNNEHRVPLPRLLLLGLLNVTGGDFRAGMFFNIVSLSAMALAMMRLASSLRGGQSRFVDAFFPVALLHLGNWENLYWSWQLSFVISVILACVMLYVLVADRALQPSGAAALGLSIVLLPLCGGTGLLFVPILALWLIFLGLTGKPKPGSSRSSTRARAILIIAAIVSLLLTGLYFVDYQTPSWTPPNPGLLPSLVATLQFLGLAIGPVARSSWFWSAFAVLLALLLSAGYLLRSILRSRGPDRRRALGLFLFLATMGLFALAMGYGRAGVIAIYGSWPIRYVLLAVPVLLLAFFAWELYAPPKIAITLQMSIFLGLCILIPANTTHGLWWRDWYQAGAVAFQQDVLAGTPISSLAQRHRPFLFHSMSESQLADYMRMLRDANLGPFTYARDETRDGASQTRQRLVTREISYYMPQAQSVYLVWGVDGWLAVDESIRPSGTVVKDGAMHSPLTPRGDHFTITLQVPIGSMVEYGFLTTSLQGGIDARIWEADGKNDFRLSATEDGATVVHSSLTPEQSLSNASAADSLRPGTLQPVMIIGLILLFIVVYHRIQRQHDPVLPQASRYTDIQ